MISEDIIQQLLGAGLDADSVTRMLGHYKDMRFFLGNGRYQEAILHVGKFCENAGNIVLGILGQPLEQSPSLGSILTAIERHQNVASVDSMIRIAVPRFLRAAYEIRSRRDGVHTNLEIPVNHGDANMAVQICSWILAEFIRAYGAPQNLTKARKLIENLAQPISPFIDEYNGIHMIMNNKLSKSQEILVHLNNSPGGELEVEQLTRWIPGATTNHIRTSLRQLQGRRLVHYAGERAKITPLGSNAIENVIRTLDTEVESVA